MKILLTATAVLCLTISAFAADTLDGHIIDVTTGRPVSDATITMGSVLVKGDPAGHFQVVAYTASPNLRILVRAPGYRADTFTLTEMTKKKNTLALTPFTPHALYLSVYGISSKPIRDAAFDIIHKGGANALVVDIKSDRGLLTYPSDIPLAREIGARKITLLHSLPELVNYAHGEGAYMIARIVVFKDAALGTARPDLAVHLANGALFHDGEGIAWTDPWKSEVRAYNIAIALEAAQAGFDEVQFDYVRFPDGPTKLSFSGSADESGRIQAVTDFLVQAHTALAPYNIFESADIFGYVAWNLNDTGIGQQLQSIVDSVDYVCPMLYPSGFKFGIPGHRNPMATNDDIYNIIRLSIENSIKRTHANPKKFRPWLQAFRDYAFGGKVFGPIEIADQIRGAKDADTDGWILWNPHNHYQEADLPKDSSMKFKAYDKFK